MLKSRTLRAVLFDLDGTLVDSAPDLFAALVSLRAARALPEPDYATVRAYASRGALGMIEAGFADHPELDRNQLRDEFLDFYAQHLWVRSSPFSGIEPLLDGLAEHGLGLAVVTNKLERFAAPLVAAAGWAERFACVIGGDSAARPKPHPAPVLEACRRLGIHPGDALMVGDDARDIEAGRLAGAATAAVTWGYLPPGEEPASWGADGVLDDPMGILEKYFNQ